MFYLVILIILSFFIQKLSFAFYNQINFILLVFENNIIYIYNASIIFNLYLLKFKFI